MNAVGALALLDAERLVRTADVAAALSMEALHGVPYAYDARTHALRPFRGQNAVASNLRRLIEGSGIVERYKRDRVQDTYSLHYSSSDLSSRSGPSGGRTPWPRTCAA